MRTFCTVVDCKSIVVAAQKIGKTPAAVSTALKKLEEEVGGELFEGERKNRLTAVGMYFYEKSRKQLEYFEHFELSVERFIKAKEGTCSILSVPSVTRLLVAPSVQKHRKEAPNAHFTIGDMSSDDIIFQVQNGNADLGIVSTPHQGTLHTPGLEKTHLFTDRLGVVFHKAHALAKHSSITWEDCAAHDPVFNPLCRLVTHGRLKKKLANCPIKIEADNTNSIIALLSAGASFSILPELLQHYLPTEIQFALPKKPFLYRDVVAVFGHHASLTPVAARMLEILKGQSQLLQKK